MKRSKYIDHRCIYERMHINLRATLYFLELSRDPSPNIKNYDISNLILSVIPDIRQFWHTTAFTITRAWDYFTAHQIFVYLFFHLTRVIFEKMSTIVYFSSDLNMQFH